MGLMTLISTIKITAAIIIAAKHARGIYPNHGVKNKSARITRIPEKDIIYN